MTRPSLLMITEIKSNKILLLKANLQCKMGPIPDVFLFECACVNMIQ